MPSWIGRSTFRIKKLLSGDKSYEFVKVTMRSLAKLNLRSNIASELHYHMYHHLHATLMPSQNPVASPTFNAEMAQISAHLDY